MDYEKKYKDALERAEGIIKYYKEHNRDEASIEDLETIFPELAEREDEKIRKALIDFFKRGAEYGEQTNGVCDKDILAWLEKQGEQEEPQVYETEDGEIITYSETDGYKIVEPKFKVGDLIVWQGKCYKVNYNGCGYELIDQNGLSTSLEYGTVDTSARLWTIQDAKDGDVLAVNNEVFIYAHRKQMYSIAVAHCFVDSVCGFYPDGEFGYTEKGNPIYPATKEQRDLLFQKMKEAGYEWDADKLELRKISQRMVSAEAKEALYDKPKWDISDFRTWQYIVSDVLTKKDGIGQYIDSGECKKIAKYMQEEWSKKLSIEQTPKKLIKGEDYGIDGLYHAQRILEKTLGEVDGYQTDDGILEHQCAITAVKKLYEQKPTWSEEDEVKINRIVSWLENLNVAENDILLKDVDWLKSLKDRVRPQNQCSYNPYKAVIESIAEMCKHYDKASHSALRDFYDNVKVKCKDAKEYDTMHPQNHLEAE